MGKGAIIAAVFVVFTTMTMLFNSQMQSKETDDRELEQQSNQLSRELAMVGRKLVLADWIESNGANTSPPFNVVNRDGGRIFMDPAGYIMTPGTSENQVDFTVRAEYDSTLHEVRSRFSWSNLALNPVQLKVADLTPTIEFGAELDFDNIVIDDQSLLDLEDVLITDLAWGTDLSDFGLGYTPIETALRSALDGAGYNATSINQIDQAARDLYSTQDGIFFPDQVNQAVTEFALNYPAQHQVFSDASTLSGTFGIEDGYEMLTIEGDMVLGSDFQGHGILVVEGDLIVPSGISFDWEGIVLVKPPALSASIDFSGNVNIEGSLVALQESVPNTGHMDLSIYRDTNGFWATPQGAEVVDQEVLKHTHNYTKHEGNYVVFHSDDPLAPDHDSYSKFDNTLNGINPADSVFFEIFNSGAHGLGLIKMDLTTGTPVIQRVNSGFDGAVRDPGNAFRTRPIPVSELEHFDIIIPRLSSLKKMWDTDDNYPGCDSADGPRCVWRDYNRYGALTIRIYTHNAVSDKMIYGASLYWHRQNNEEEIEEFEDEMTELVADLQSDDYGLDLNIGANTTIKGDIGAIVSLPAFSSGFGSLGVQHLGTWHRQWDRDDPQNPLRLQVY